MPHNQNSFLPNANNGFSGRFKDLFIRQHDGNKKSLINKVNNFVKRWIGRGLFTPVSDPDRITQSTLVGSSRLSPFNDLHDRQFTEYYSRQDLLAQIRRMLADNPLLHAAWIKMVDGAITNFQVVVNRTAMTGFSAQRQGQAQRIIDRLVKRCELVQKARGWARWLVAEGDLYLQVALSRVSEDSFEIIKVQKMPAATMERLSDDLDRFTDPNRAFIQRDLHTNRVIQEYAEWQIIHARYQHEDGNRYGNSLFFPVRKIAEDVLDLSHRMADRRRANHPTLVHMLSNADGTRVSQFQMDEYKHSVSKLERIKRGHGVSEYDELFANGSKIEVLSPDENLHHIDDVTFLYDLSLSTTGVSRQLLGSGATVNRDILDEQRAEMYAGQAVLTDVFSDQILRPLFDFALMLSGIDPETVTYNIDWKQRFTESAMERRIDRALKSHMEGTLSAEDVMRVQADYFNIEDIKSALERNKAEKQISPDSASEQISGQRPDLMERFLKRNIMSDGHEDGEHIIN